MLALACFSSLFHKLVFYCVSLLFWCTHSLACMIPSSFRVANGFVSESCVSNLILLLTDIYRYLVFSLPSLAVLFLSFSFGFFLLCIVLSFSSHFLFSSLSVSLSLSSLTVPVIGWCPSMPQETISLAWCWSFSPSLQHVLSFFFLSFRLILSVLSLSCSALSLCHSFTTHRLLPLSFSHTAPCFKPPLDKLRSNIFLFCFVLFSLYLFSRSSLLCCLSFFSLFIFSVPPLSLLCFSHTHTTHTAPSFKTP